jgi:hypothetical protein
VRDGWIEIGPGVGTPREAVTAAPSIQWQHVDGPLLTWAGQLHWLTWRERFTLWLGKTTPEAIAEARWPVITAARLRTEVRMEESLEQL